MDGGVVALTFGVALLIGVVLGTIPVVQVLRRDLSSIFREEGRTGSSSAERGGRPQRCWSAPRSPSPSSC